MNISENLPEETEIQGLVEFAVSTIKPLADAENKSVIDWVDAFLYEWQQNGKPPMDFVESEDLIPALAAIWAAKIVEMHKWAWVLLTFHDFDDWQGMAIVSPDRSLMILPFAYFHECLSQEDEVKISASLVALESNIIPPQPEKSYTNIMHGLQRIVPRG